MAIISLRNIVLALRLGAGMFAAAGLTLYVIILAKVTDDRFPGNKTALTALPIGGAAASIIWNIIALATATFTCARPILFSTVDFAVAIVLITLGAIGLRHDTVNYLSNVMYKQYDNGPWLAQEIAGGSLLLISVLIQLLLALLNVSESRRLWVAPTEASAPPYTYGAGPHKADLMEGEKYVDVDWKSFVSEDSLTDSLIEPEAIKV
ncbi:uncharacterized protein RAG0_08930 [Rhynchosporium agropyri]|uniref:Uncharacterized protein n=1 Tax=Rhynchosporium agropyri TaxID=914238 RepID=A0A1E1KT30_9HELO|nr:uncharacterized protein RAG0_08930 [Rhynchosporium agropyri]